MQRALRRLATGLRSTWSMAMLMWLLSGGRRPKKRDAREAVCWGWFAAAVR
jgi:hypothetical protein